MPQKKNASPSSFAEPSSHTSSSSLFHSLYKTLNPSQKQAVDTIEGPVMVIAGPGTGKTQVLTARIAQILQITDTPPHSILALTFTESAAKNMRERLVKMIGKTGYYVQIATFHAFCKEVIDSHPEAFPIERNSTPLSDLERFELFEEIFQNLTLEHIKPLNTPFFYIKDAIKAISDLKREGINLQTYAELLEEWEQRLQATEPPVAAAKKKTKKAAGEKSRTEWEKEHKQLQKNKELWQVYTTYQKRLRETKRFDFDDMIALVVEAFQNNELLLREYQEDLHYFLVDEYQDTNAAQNTVVNLLANYWEENANIFVVGDPNQAIYRFQGASVENMLGFMQQYPNAVVITLNTGYRCPQGVYDTAAKLIEYNKLDFSSLHTIPDQSKLSHLLSTPLKSIHGKGEKTAVVTTASQVLEAIQIAESIKKLLHEGTPAHEIAVLYRHNADRTVLAEVFDTWGISYEVEGGGNALREEIIRQLITLFRVVASLRTGLETEILYETLQYEWLRETFGWEKSVVLKIARAASKARLPLLDLIEKGVESINIHNPGHEITPLEFQPILTFVNQLKTWDTDNANETFPQWFENVLQQSGLLAHILRQEAQVYLVTVLNSVFSEVKKMAASNHSFKLADFLRAIELIEEHSLQITIEDLNVRQQAVHLSTVHKAKGREWDSVFLFECIDKKWGNNRKKELIKLPMSILHNTDPSLKERNEDERRLFYVALTRAKRQVIISHPETVVTEGYSRDVVPSMFLAEIEEFDPKETLWHKQESLPVDTHAADHLAKLLQPAPLSMEVGEREKIYLRWLLDNFRWSVTALNTYLQDPEKFIQNTLLRLPRAKTPILAFGTAVHSSMEFLFSTFQQTHQYPSLEKLLLRFEKALEQEILTPAEHTARLKYGKEVLTHYWSQLAQRTPNPLYIERFFGNGKHRVMLGDIPLTGRIDRIDWLDIDAKKVKVIDYKTGKAKTAGEIEGSTASSSLSARERALPENIRGPYKRQLLFYKLLTELDLTFPYEVVSGEFEFVEPNDKNKTIIREFPLLTEDVQALKNLIQHVVSELRERWK